MSEEKKDPPKPKAPASVMEMRGHPRPFARVGESHLVVLAATIYCKRCKAVSPRPAGATHVLVEHEPDCRIVAAAA